MGIHEGIAGRFFGTEADAVRSKAPPRKRLRALQNSVLLENGSSWHDKPTGTDTPTMWQ